MNKKELENATVEKDWIFTFGCGQENAGHYVKINGTFDSARDEMFRRYGDAWAFQYSADEFFSTTHSETELEE